MEEEQRNPVLEPFYDVKEKRYESFFTVKEAYMKAGLEKSDDKEIQAHRIASAQGALCCHADANDDFVAIKISKDKPKKYGYTKKQRLLISDTSNRNRRAEKSLEKATNRSERMLARFPKKEKDLQLTVIKRRVILIKRSKNTEVPLLTN